MPTPRNGSREHLNGIAEDRRAELKEKLSDAREVTAFSGPWKVRTVWDGGFRTHAEARGHKIDFDEPADLAAEDTAPTPHEYVLSAAAACISTGFVLHATIAGVSVRSVDIEVAGTFDNILKWAGLTEHGSPGYRSLEIRARIDAEADTDVIQRLWDQALAGSPVAQTVQRPTPIVAALEIVD